MRPSLFVPISDDAARRRELGNIYETDPDYIGANALADMIGTGKGNLWSMRRNSRFPVKPRRKFGKRPMWAVRDMQRWMDVGKPHHRKWREGESDDALYMQHEEP